MNFPICRFEISDVSAKLWMSIGSKSFLKSPLTVWHTNCTFKVLDTGFIFHFPQQFKMKLVLRGGGRKTKEHSKSGISGVI